MKKGWEVRPLGDFVTSRQGNNKIIKGKQSNAPLPGLFQAYSASGPDVWVKANDYQQPGVVLSAVGARCGKTFLAEGQWTAIANTHVLLPTDGIDVRWLWYRTNDESFWVKAGTAQPFVKVKETLSRPCPIPPLPEQRRIVAILDEAFEGIAAAKANAERNLRNAKAMFDSLLQSIFAQRLSGWVEKKRPLSDMCELIVDCEHKTAPTQGEGYPSIRTPNIGKGKLLLEGVNRVSQATYNAWTRRAKPLAGDLILAREAPAGNVAVIPEDTPVCLGQRTVLIRPKAEIFDPYFLAVRLLEPQMQERLLAHSRGATVQHVNMKDIRALDVGAIPPLPVQQQIAGRVRIASDEGDRLACFYKRKIAALDALKKAFLEQAFTGQL